MSDVKSFTVRSACPVCGNSACTILYKKKYDDPSLSRYLLERYKGRIEERDLEGEVYEIRYCAACTHVFQAAIPTDELMGRLYSYDESRVAKSIEKKTGADISYYAKNARFVEKIAILFKKKPGDINVLEFAMGWGYFARMALAYGYKVYGLEISKERIEFAQKSGLTIIQSLTDVPDVRFDFVQADQVFEHLQNPLATLRELSDHMKAGSIIYIGVPNGKEVKAHLESWKEGDAPPKEVHPLEHINCFTHTTLVRLCTEAGFELVPSFFIAKTYAKRLKSAQGLDYVREILKSFYSQKRGTELYFMKK